MKIEALRFIDGQYGEQDRSILLIDGKKRVNIGNLCECPEDAIIGRGLIDADDIMSYMEEAYKLGGKGKEVIFSSRKITADELEELE